MIGNLPCSTTPEKTRTAWLGTSCRQSCRGLPLRQSWCMQNGRSLVTIIMADVRRTQLRRLLQPCCQASAGWPAALSGPTPHAVDQEVHPASRRAMQQHAEACRWILSPLSSLSCALCATCVPKGPAGCSEALKPLLMQLTRHHSQPWLLSCPCTSVSCTAPHAGLIDNLHMSPLSPPLYSGSTSKSHHMPPGQVLLTQHTRQAGSSCGMTSTVPPA